MRTLNVFNVWRAKCILYIFLKKKNSTNIEQTAMTNCYSSWQHILDRCVCRGFLRYKIAIKHLFSYNHKEKTRTGYLHLNAARFIVVVVNCSNPDIVIRWDIYR